MADLAPVREGFRGYQRSLSGIERRLGRENNLLYRDLRAGLIDELDRYGFSGTSKLKIREAFGKLRFDASLLTGEYLSEIEAVSNDYAKLQFKKIKKAGGEVPSVIPRSTVSLDAVGGLEWIDLAEAGILGEFSRLSLSGELDPTRVLSVKLVEDRASAYRRGRNSMRASTVLGLYGAGNAILNSIYAEASKVTDYTYKRQAIATIDERTTDCCLYVHSQIVPLKGKFALVGTPRFASFIGSPPFHWYCRTSIVVYHEKLDEAGITTDIMKNSASLEIEARRVDKYLGLPRVEIHPSSATSGR